MLSPPAKSNILDCYNSLTSARDKPAVTEQPREPSIKAVLHFMPCSHLHVCRVLNCPLLQTQQEDVQSAMVPIHVLWNAVDFDQ